MSEDGDSRSPEEYASSGIWEVEPLYYSLVGRSDRNRRGKAYRSRSDGELRCFEAHDGVKYRPGDHVYVEVGTMDPFIVGTVVLFKMSKRDSLTVKITRFFRPEDVPEISLSLILQERNEVAKQAEPIVDTHSRELFTSDSSLSYPISSLRGKCEVSFVKDFRSLADCDLSKENAFFSCLSYNQDSSRLASVQGEIRVGQSYQANLPPPATCSVGDEEDRDELIYRPNQIDAVSEKNYIKLARSFRLFAMMDCKLNSVEKNARVSDLLFDDSIATLHRCGYKYDVALKEMSANDKLLACDSNFMTPEESKRFSKGIRTHGKNFVKIYRELLPMHSREQLVAYYYLWKKTSEATKPKPLSKQRNNTNNSKKTRNGNAKTSRPTSPQLNDYASASESEVESDVKRTSQYACHHCYSEKSRDWHHAGRDGLLLCTDCRLFFKKYGQLRSVERPSTVPPCLFKRSPSGTDPEEESGVRTRAGKNGRRRTPSMGDERRSPSQAASIHEIDLEKIKNPKSNKRKSNKNHFNQSAKKKKSEEKEDIREDKDVEMKPSTSPQSTEDNNGLKAEILEGLECKEEIKEEMQSATLDVQPSTSTSSMSNEIKDEESSDTEPCLEDNEGWEIGNEECHTSPNSIFIRNIVRKSNSCARSDLIYKMKPGGTYDLFKQEKERLAKNPPPTVPIQVPVKKPEASNPLSEAPRLPINGFPPGFPANMDPNMMMAFLQMQMAQAQHVQQAHAQAQAQAQAQQQAQAQAQLEQQQQMMKQLEMQQRQQQLNNFMQQRDAAARLNPMMAPFMDQRMLAAASAQMPFMHGQPTQEMRMQMEMLAQLHMAQQMQQQPGQMPANMPPEMQQAMMNPQVMQQMMQQHLMANPMAQFAAAGLHPGLAQSQNMMNSDMMRRLQQEAFQLNPMRPQ